MYTLLELESKTFGELKTIGYELNVLPEGDRRRRKSWIDAIAGVNPPLLQLLETSPENVQAQESPQPSQGAIAKKSAFPQLTRCFNCEEEDGFVIDRWGELVECPLCGGSRWKEISEGDQTGAENSPAVKVDPVQGAISQVAKTSPGVEVDPVQEALPECFDCFGDGYVEDAFGFIKCCSQCLPENKSEPKMSQSAIAPVVKNLPGSRSKTSTAHQLLELFKSSAHIIEDSPGVKTEAKVSESAIEPAAKNHLDAVESEHPKSKAITFSDRFLARYSPPQPENIIFKSEPDGQLSLLDFEVQSQDEPPDPDDFESLDAFREAIARWDWEHPSRFDHCSDHLPSSVQNEPPNPDDFDSMFAFWAAYDAWDEASDDDSEPLEISLDSFCEWAPCPLDWYEPADLLEPSKVSELSAVAKSSITSEFFIPTFGRWGDRSDRNDEPPDTGIFARLPKPKPPKFPPQASQPKSAQVRRGRASRNYPETIPKQFSRVAAGSSTQPARSPPGGDA